MRRSRRNRHAVEDAIDRLQEAHWYIHEMEIRYHDPDPFRYALNSFLRALKEVPDVLRMAMENEPNFSAWFSERRKKATCDALVSKLFGQRNILVHRRMLATVSIATIGITELRGIKLGFTKQVDPFCDSDDLMVLYLAPLYRRDWLKQALECLRKGDDFQTVRDLLRGQREEMRPSSFTTVPRPL